MKMTKRKLELLDLCSRMFYRHGYTGTTMKMLAEEAILEPASFYSHFESKEQILFLICTKALRELLEELESEKTNSNEVSIDSCLSILLDYVSEEPYGWSVLHKELIHLKDEYLSLIEGKYEYYTEMILDTLRKDINMWRSKQLDPRITIKILQSSIGIIAELNEEEKINARIIITEILTHGIKQ